MIKNFKEWAEARIVEEMDDMEKDDSMGRRIRQPKNMKVNRPHMLDNGGLTSVDQSYALISQLKKPQVQMAVGKILKDEPQTAEFLKDILNRALKYASMDHYNKPSFPGWSGGWHDSQSAANNFVGNEE